ILRHPHGHLLKTSVFQLDKSMLRCDLKPSPMVGALRTLVIHGLTRSECEEVTDFSMQSCSLLIPWNLNKTFGISHNQRFSFPIKPKVLIQPRLIKILVNLLDGFPATFCRSKSHHKSDLWRSDSILAGFRK